MRVSSGPWIIKNYHHWEGDNNNISEEAITTQIVFDKFKEGDPCARKVVDDFIKAISSAMANIILAFSITDFIVTGGVSKSFPIFHRQLIQEVRKRSISHLNNQIDIKRGILNDSAGIMGAASLIFKKRL